MIALTDVERFAGVIITKPAVQVKASTVNECLHWRLYIGSS